MGYAIELFFDPESEGRLLALWETLAEFGAPGMRQGDARPHVSLGVADAVEVEAACGMLDDLAREVRVFPLTLTALGFFPSHERVAFLAPKVTSELLALQERVFGAFQGVAQGLWPHYEPAQWTPHCTLSMGLGPEHLEAAWEACRQFGLPRNCLVTEIGLVEFRPVRHLHTAALGA